MKKVQSTQYQAYLLRLWREAGGGWRAVLEDAHSETRRSFASLPALFEFLREATAEAQDISILHKGERK